MNTTSDSAVAEASESGPSAGEPDQPPEPESARTPDGLHLECAPDAPSVDLPWIERQIRAVIALLEEPVERVSIRLVGDPEMATLHVRHMGIDGPTDVLTFPASEAGAPIEVDVAIGAAYAARSAEERGITVEREILLYAVHALLHVSGYDDHDPYDFERMHAREDELLRAIGVGAIFRPDGEGAE